MLQNQTIASSISTSISTAVPSSLAQSLRTAPSQPRVTARSTVTGSVSHGLWPQLAQTLRLPDTTRAFLLFSLAVALLCSGMTLHLFLAIRILESRVELSRLHTEYKTIQRDSTTVIWAISQETTLDRVQARAVEAGYTPTFERHYVIQPVAGVMGAESTHTDNAGGVDTAAVGAVPTSPATQFNFNPNSN